MGKMLLNNYSMNEVLAILKKASEGDEISRFKVQCENCTLSIVTGNLNGNKGTVEVALRNVNDSTWIELETEDRSIIPALPLIAFPAFVRQFKTLQEEDFAEVWDAWGTISYYM